MADGILFMFGGAGYLAPIALFACGAAIIIRPMLPAVHPLKTGGACLAAALTLGLAAGSLGLGPGDTPRDGFLDADYLRHHGGLVGESLFWSSAKLFSEAGSHILFVFLLLAGVLLITGASVAGVVQATRDAATTTSDRVRRLSTTAPAPVVPSVAGAHPAQPPPAQDPGPGVRAPPAGAPPPDGAGRDPDPVRAEPEPE